jgi:hypothetical protein
MRITDCSLTRSLLHLHAWSFAIEINGFKFTGYFEDFGGFITMVTECAKFFAIRAGKLRAKDAGLSRDVAPGGFGFDALPGDRKP